MIGQVQTQDVSRTSSVASMLEERPWWERLRRKRRRRSDDERGRDYGCWRCRIRDAFADLAPISPNSCSSAEYRAFNNMGFHIPDSPRSATSPPSRTTETRSVSVGTSTISDQAIPVSSSATSSPVPAAWGSRRRNAMVPVAAIGNFSAMIPRNGGSALDQTWALLRFQEQLRASGVIVDGEREPGGKYRSSDSRALGPHATSSTAATRSAVATVHGP